jgi:dTDP-4-dehydrorhamnose 3,5-epimerase
VYPDDRGYFIESYNKRTLEDHLCYGVNFIQDNVSYSKYGVIRGLHFQIPPFSQSKLVRCLEGCVLDVAVDLRTHKPTYGKVFKIVLTPTSGVSVLIPKGFAHGFSVLSEGGAVFEYKCDRLYHKVSERGIRYDDKTLNINWELGNTTPIISEKDLQLPDLLESQNYFKH